jgi:hypothetical protein
MSYSGTGILLFAAVAGTSGAGLATPATALTAPATAGTTSQTASPSPSPTAAPASVSVSPVLTQQSSRTWTTILYLNFATLCPQQPSFELVTTNPYNDVSGTAVFSVPGGATFTPKPGCSASSFAAAAPLTQVTLTFGPSNALATPPVTAAVVVTPAAPTAAPLQITVAVHRRVTSYEYAWIPLACGLALALALIATILLTGLRNPYASDQRKDRMYRARFWNRPLYAAAAWTFSGSWATNITALGAVVAAVLTATGTVSELLPGVEPGRFSLLIAVAGGITVAAPLVFGALNYRFARVDPTTAGVSVLTLPSGPVAVLRGQTLSVLLGWLRPGFRQGGTVVAVAPDAQVTSRGGNAVLLNADDNGIKAGNWVTLQSNPLSMSDGLPVQHRKATLPDGGKSLTTATVAVPAGATITLLGGARVEAAQLAATSDAPPAAANDAPLQPGQATADLKPGIALSVPPGAIITASQPDAPQPDAPQPDAAAANASPALALPGGSDIAVFAGQKLTISTNAAMVAADVLPDQAPGKPGLTLRRNSPITVTGGAKITFLGRASLKLPAGTLVTAPGTDVDQAHAARGSYLKVGTVFQLPHTGQVVAAQMWSLLAASFLTLFGTGAELGILGVLAWSLSSGDFAVRLTCVIAAAAVAVIVCFYGVVSIRALADPMPGDALTASGGTAFML